MNRLDIEGNMVEMVVAALIIVGTIIVNIIQRANKWINEKRMMVNRPEREEEKRAPVDSRQTEARVDKPEDPGAILLRELERALRGDAGLPTSPEKTEPADQRGFPQTPEAANPLETMQREADADRESRRLSGVGAPEEPTGPVPSREAEKTSAPAPKVPAPRRAIPGARAAARRKYQPTPADSSAYDLDQRSGREASLAVIQNRADVLRGIVAHEILSPPRARRAPGKRAF